MRTKDFFITYDLKELDTLEIAPYEGVLSILVSFDVDIAYIANGFRPTYETNYHHRFVFLDVPSQYLIKNPKIEEYSLKGDEIHLKMDGGELIIPDSKVEAINNE